MNGSAEVVRFGPTSGVVTGWIGLSLAALVVVTSAVGARSADDVRMVLGAAAAGVLVWAYLLRPRVLLTERSVVLRNPLSQWEVPLASITGVRVRSVTRLEVTGRDRELIGVGVGRHLRKMAGERVRERSSTEPAGPERPRHSDEADVMITRIESLIALAGGAADSGAQVRRRWAWPEIAALLVLVAGLVVAMSV